jgi:hypothetical protein
VAIRRPVCTEPGKPLEFPTLPPCRLLSSYKASHGAVAPAFGVSSSSSGQWPLRAGYQLALEGRAVDGELRDCAAKEGILGKVDAGNRTS